MGKFEKRKIPLKSLKIGLKNMEIISNINFLAVCQTLFQGDQMSQIINQTLEGQNYGNINFLPHLKTNSDK